MRIFRLDNIYFTTKKWITFLSLAAGLLLTYGLLTGLYVAPIDYQQQAAVKIMYVHVPCAVLSLMVYTIIGISSFVYLVWKIKLADIVAQVSASLGAAYTLVALVSGSLWGKPMWGTWWVWDARLTSELILLFLYFGYIGLRNGIRNPNLAAHVCAVLAIIGLIDIPIIHFSVEWWNTLHQGASISKLAKPSIDPAMLYPLLSTIIGLFIFYVLLVLTGVRSEILWRERKTSWVQELLRT